MKLADNLNDYLPIDVEPLIFSSYDACHKTISLRQASYSYRTYSRQRAGTFGGSHPGRDI